MKQPVISDKQLALRDKILLIKEKKSLNSAELSRITGRSEGTISDLIGNKKAFSDKLILLVTDLLRDYMGEADLVETSQYAKMWNIAKIGKQESDIRLVVGNTGIGKSVVFKKFAEENSHTCYYKIVDNKLTWNNFLLDVCVRFGLKLPNKKRIFTTELMKTLVTYVEEHADRNPMLIVDESEVMRNTFFKEFKNLRTATEDLLSIVIVGITEVESKIARLAGLDPKTWLPSREDSNQYTTFARRIKHFRIQNISTDDIRHFCLQKGIVNDAVIKEAQSKWWNYAEADRAVRRAEKMGLVLKDLTIDEFKVL